MQGLPLFSYWSSPWLVLVMATWSVAGDVSMELSVPRMIADGFLFEIDWRLAT